MRLIWVRDVLVLISLVSRAMRSREETHQGDICSTLSAPNAGVISLFENATMTVTTSGQTVSNMGKLLTMLCPHALLCGVVGMIPPVLVATLPGW